MTLMLCLLLVVFVQLGSLTSAESDGICTKFGLSRSVLNIDLEWVMQGYQIGFQGFFVELLGFSDSIVKLLPHARLVKSSFRKSFDESPFPSEKFLNLELFQNEEGAVRSLSSAKQAEMTVQMPNFIGSKQIDDIDCSNAALFEQDYVYRGAELAKHVATGARSPTDCCVACVSNPLCLAWSFDSDLCSLKGRMDQSGVAIAGALSGRMISRTTSSSSTIKADGTTDEAAAPSALVVKRRSPVPRVIVFHGTTCIHLNHSVSMATRDINTVLIGRYMLERPYLVGGYNLDEYAVMHCAARMDEIWVPTAWHKAVFTRLFSQQGSLSSMPLITVIPEAVNTDLFDPHFPIDVDGALRRSIVGEDRRYVADATRLSAEQLRAVSATRINVRKHCVFTPSDSDKNISDNNGSSRVVCDHGHKFEFLSVFKWEYRKGWDVMLDAYWAAFQPSDHVVLRIRSYVPHTSAGDRNIGRIIETYAQRVHDKGLDELASVVWETGVEGFTVPSPYTPAPSATPPSVEEGKETSEQKHLHDNMGATAAAVVVEGVVVAGDVEEEVEVEPETHRTREDMRALLASANAFVLATRGEGWGLPIAEAMAMALPVIVTNHSGPAAYATVENAYLIPVAADLDEFSFAKPDVPSLAQLMRLVVRESSEEAGYLAQQRGLRARETMKAFSPDSIVCQMNERLRYHASIRGWQLP